jgi:ABC-type sugar transport system, periplasmic component
MKDSILKKLISIIAVTAMIISLAACGSSSQSNETATSLQTTNGESSASVAKEDGPLSKYDPEIEITTVKAVDENVQYAEGESLENNVWINGYKNDLGIKVKFLWTSPTTGDQFNQKLNVSIASGDVADIFACSNQQMASLVDAGLIQDLSGSYDKYASDLTKKYIEQDPYGFASSKFEGKLMGLPLTGNPVWGAPLLWIRYDWLQKLGLQEPKTMQDVLAISEAFTTKDPDGNNKNDTYGLGITQDLYNNTTVASIEGLFDSYHAYPRCWLKDSNGKLVYGGIQPEMKNALKTLQDMFKAGQLDKEFGTKDTGKVIESITAGKIGMEYGSWWNPDWPLNSSKDADPKAEWRCYSNLSSDDKPALSGVENSVWQWYVVSKNCKYPEAAVKMYNYWNEKMFGPNNENEVYGTGKSNNNEYNQALVLGWPPDQNFTIYTTFKEALEANDDSKVNNYDLPLFKNIKAYLAGDKSKWGNYVCYEQGRAALVKINDAKSYVFNEFYGVNTPTMTEKQPTLEKMLAEMMTKIIMGHSLDEFDKFVTDWKKLGGDKITEEVNAWYEKNKQ